VKVSLSFGDFGRPSFVDGASMTELNSTSKGPGSCLGPLGKVPLVTKIPLGQMADIMKDRVMIFLHHIGVHQVYTKTHRVWGPCMWISYIWVPHAWVSYSMCLGVDLM
jgi:hypothetical protein